MVAGGDRRALATRPGHSLRSVNGRFAQTAEAGAKAISLSIV
jgi:hypothetical protein